MKRYVGKVLILSLFAAGIALETSAQTPQWPAISQQNKPWTRWWWEGSAVTPADISWILEEYSKAGLGGVEITPIYGVRGQENNFINFLSPKWMEMLSHTLREGKRLNLGVDMAQASGWPFGGPWVSDADASKYVAYKTYSLKGGEKLKEPVQYMQAPIVRTVGTRIDVGSLREPIASNPDLQQHAFDQVRFPKPLPLQALMAYSEKGQVIDLSSRVDAAGNLNWTAPAGNWNLYATFQGWHGKMVERAGPGGEGYAIDHFSKQATENYLQHFDEAFKGYDLSSLRAFFNDSYEVDDAQGEANWTPRFFEEFRQRRGYDLKQQLPALFGKDKAEKNTRVLSDYRETISDLLLENYTKAWHNWAKKHGGLIRNQAHGSPANILDLYAATDIPEIEGTEILRIKFASSAAHVTGKPLVSSESATWENEHFLSKLGDVRRAMDQFLLGGVNHTFYHGANFTPKNAQWPGWLFYAAVHFTPNNPFWADFNKLNNYVAHVQSFMQQGKPANDVLLYLPVYDAYATPGRSMLVHFDGLEKGFRGSSVEACAEFLQEKGYGFDYISDAQLLGTSVSGKQITTGGAMYQTILVPQTQYMPLATLKKLTELATAGASVVFFKSTPADVPGYGNLEARRKEFKSLISAFGFVHKGAVKSVATGTGMVIQADELGAGLDAATVGRERMVDQGLEFIRRKHDKGYYYFVVNRGENDIDGYVQLNVEAGSVAIFNPMTEKSGYAALKNASEGTGVYLQLAKGESLILETFNEARSGSAYPYTEAAGEAHRLTGKWTIEFKSGGPTLPATIKTKELKSWTDLDGQGTRDFSGAASYSIKFKRPKGKAASWLLDLGQVRDNAEVRLNGQLLATLIGPRFSVEIPSSALKKKNRLDVLVANSMANRIAYMDRNNLPWKIFYNTNMPARRRENAGADGLFSAARWSPQPSGILGPVSISPLKLKKLP